MSAYIIRRMLLMIPTLFGIMLVSFVVVQFAPGGPVERVIAQLPAPTPAPPRASQALAGGDFGARGQPQERGRRCRRLRSIAARRASIRNSSRAWRSSSASTSRPIERFFLMLRNYMPVRFRQELFPRRQRAAADQGEAAGLDLARHLDDVADLSDLDPARHPQGGQGRLAVRRLDLRRRSSSAMPSRASCSPFC